VLRTVRFADYSDTNVYLLIYRNESQIEEMSDK